MTYLRALILTLALTAAVSVSLARAQTEQSGSADTGETVPEATTNTPDPDRKEYLVEVIAFQYLGPDSSGSEYFDHVFIDDYLPPEPLDLDENNRLRELVSYADIAVLKGALERLRQDSRYRVLANLAWVQPLLDKNESIEVPLDYDTASTASMIQDQTGTTASGTQSAFPESTSSRITGTMRVYGDHLLFVELELKAALPDRSGTEEAGSKFFHISEKRRIKLEEFHYFDHPYFGAIVTVSRHGGSGEG